MTYADLERLVLRRNLFHLGLGVSLVLAAIVLWLLSFWVWRWLFLYVTFRFGFRGLENVGFYVALGCTLLLVIEGVRYRGELFDMKAFHESAYYDNILTDNPSGAALNSYLGDPMAMAYLISQAFFCAPRTTVLAWQNLRSVCWPRPEILDTAAWIRNQLAEEHKWLPVSTFPQCGAALCLLDQLGLIWTDCKGGEVLVRIPTGLKPGQWK